MNGRNIKEFAFRNIILIWGLFILAFGVALSTKANSRVSPISCVPYVVSLITPLTMWQIMFTMLTFFIILQILILRSEFQWLQLTQLLVALIYSEMTDLTLWIMRDVEVNNYFARWGLCIVSFFLVATGIATEVCADVSLMAGDGLVKSISYKTGIEFGKIKIAFDCTLTLTGAIIGLLTYHTLTGVREGTIATAIFIGMIIRLIYKLPFVKPFLPSTQKKEKINK